MGNNRCVCCGAIIPEGTQVCYACDKNIILNKKEGQNDARKNEN